MHKILVPIDFQKQSILALEHSYYMARILNAEIILLYVVEQSGIFAGVFKNNQDDTVLSLIEEKLAELAEKASYSTGLTVSHRLEKGKINAKITEVAKEAGVEFIIMGTHSSPDDSPKEYRIGVNTSKVIRTATCPVITIQARHLYPGCRNILLPLDLTKESRQKVPLSVEIAKMYGARITAVSVSNSKDAPEILGRLHQQGDQVLDFITSAGIDCAFEIIENSGEEKDIIPTILNYASHQYDIDLIMTLTEQGIGFVEYFVGINGHEFISLSDIPIMSIVPKDLEITFLFS